MPKFLFQRVQLCLLRNVSAVINLYHQIGYQNPYLTHLSKTHTSKTHLIRYITQLLLTLNLQYLRQALKIHSDIILFYLNWEWIIKVMMIYKSGGMTQRLEQLFHIYILVDIASSLPSSLKATSFTTEK